MAVEIDTIVEAEVTSVADFGAFMSLGDGYDGMVHISEVSNVFVKDIHDFVKSGDKLKVKVTGLNKKGKYELSIKQVVEFSKDASKEESASSSSSQKLKDDDFEDKLSNYLKYSEEKQIDIRRNLKKKQGVTKRKK